MANRFEFRMGDIDKGFQEADVVVEREYHTRPVHQGYIEPHSASARWNSEGTVTIWSSSQGHFALRDHTATILGLPVSRVTIIPMEIGGGFGGKGQGGCYLEPVAATLSRKTGQPVKLTMTREEVFEGTGPTAATHIRAKMGATRDGRITAVEAHLIYEAGAFPGSPVPSGCRTMFGPYDTPNAYVEGYDVVVNTQKTAAYRAPGSPAAAFAAESLVDQLCAKLGMDPIEFRLLNASREGTRFKELAGLLNSTGGPIVGRATVNPPGVGTAFAFHIVDVEVDPETGKVDILRYTTFQDAGKAVHPGYVEGQMQGGAVQGIGWALNEEYFFNEQGQMMNPSFLDYRMPTSLDLPMIDTVIVEVPNPGHPYGVRGVGEVSIIPPMAAVANAIHDAVGVRLCKLPMSPANVLQALWEKERG